MAYKNYQNNILESEYPELLFDGEDINAGYFGLSKESYFEIQNRRYLGNKYKLLPFIKYVIEKEVGEFKSFFDIFAGTGSVAAAFNTKGRLVVANDFLSVNYTALHTFLGVTSVNFKEVISKINYLNSIEENEDNYFSVTFGDKYFSYYNAKKIGAIREEIETISSNYDEKQILLTSLVYAADRIAHTVGHYDAYRKTEKDSRKIKLLIPKIEPEINEGNIILKNDANVIIKNISADVLYIDPPYNSRQYNSAYHVLENLINWKKPEVFGIAKKMEMTETKSVYCSKNAETAFANLIKDANSKFIVVSYNNTADKMNKRSNALISDQFIVDNLSLKGQLKVFSHDYKGFTTGKAENKKNVERLFVCKVR